MKYRVWAYLLPVIFVIAFNTGLPTLMNYNYAAHSYVIGGGGGAMYAGFGMIYRAITDDRFINALGRTLLFVFLAVTIEVSLGIAIAKAMPKTGKLGGLLLMLISIPLVLPFVTIGLGWRLISRTGGILHYILRHVFLISYTLTNPAIVFSVTLLCDIWHWTPLVVIVVSAGYAAMRIEPIQAAMIDRASKWSIFRHVEIPALSFPILMAILLRTMDSLRVYDEPYMILAEGPQHCIEYVTTNIFSSLNALKVGYGAAQSLILTFIAVVTFYTLSMIITRGRGMK